MKCNTIERIILISLITIISFFAIGMYFESPWLVVMLVFSNIGFFMASIFSGSLNKEYRLQLLFICLAVLGMYSICFIRSFRRLGLLELCYAIMTILILLISVVFCLMNEKMELKYIGSVLCNHVDIIAVAVIFVVLSIRYIDNFPIYDAGAYYHDNIAWMTERFSFYFNNVIDYSMCSHTSLAYGLCMMIGVMITPHRTIGCYLVNDVIACLTILSFGMIVAYHLKCRKIYRFVLTSAFAFSPWMLGLSHNINLDNPTLYFFIIMYCCYIYRLRLFYILSAWMFVNTKEPNAIYFLFFAVSTMIYEYIENKTGLIDYIDRIKREFIAYVFIGISWILFFVSPVRSGFWVGSDMIVGGNFHTLGFTLNNFIGKIKQTFVLNFNWLLICFAIVLLILNIRKKVFRKVANELIPLIGTFLGFLMFNIFYIDFLVPRYIEIGSGILYCIVVVLLQEVTSVKAIIAALYGILLLVQSYVTIDIVSVASFYNIPLSDNYYVPIPVDSGQLIDYTYNSELINYRLCYEEILQKEELIETDAVCFLRNAPFENEFYTPGTGRIGTRDEGESFRVNKIEPEQINTWNGRIIYIVPYHDSDFYDMNCGEDGYAFSEHGKTKVFYKVING